MASWQQRKRSQSLKTLPPHYGLLFGNTLASLFKYITGIDEWINPKLYLPRFADIVPRRSDRGCQQDNSWSIFISWDILLITSS
uniref:Ycf15 n=1 Tax=Knipowitschia caucasica TaxID=637954 RepID=A0AAV2M0G7_KNICA